MSYAEYRRDSRSSWENLDRWVLWHPDYPQVTPIPERKKEAEELREIKREAESVFGKSVVVGNKEQKTELPKRRDQRVMAALGLVLLVGMIVAMTGLGAIIAFPTKLVPMAVSAIGMAAVIISLWSVGKLNEGESERLV